MDRLQARKNMDMIFDAADFFGDAAQPPNRSAQVLVEISAPGGRDEWSPVFGAENDVEMKA